MWMLVIAIYIPGGPTYFEEFPVFTNKAECIAVTNPWMDVATNQGHIAIATCEQVKI